MEMQEKIKVAILDDHQSMLDGYALRLSQHADIELVGTANFADQLTELLDRQDIHVLIMDVSVPASEEARETFPILHTIPQLIDSYPGLSILVVSMHKHGTLINALMEAGAKGYVLKDDRQSIMKLGDVVRTVAGGGVYFSDDAYALVKAEGRRAADQAILTRRQLEALSLSAASPGMKSAELANRLNIAPSTLRTLLSDAYKRLRVNKLATAVAKARQLGLISPFSPEIDE